MKNQIQLDDRIPRRCLAFFEYIVTRIPFSVNWSTFRRISLASFPFWNCENTMVPDISVILSCSSLPAVTLLPALPALDTDGPGDMADTPAEDYASFARC